ncbi:MAG: hypothetical protein H6713_13065 [Myxococcales bacterium]|nr:hypothetical protein [Myxococcales bacterium]
MSASRITSSRASARRLSSAARASSRGRALAWTRGPESRRALRDVAWSPLLALALIGCGRERPSPQHGDDAPTARPHAGLSRADECASCHPVIAREWRSSNHARAWTDPLFQDEYLETPDPACRHCHAPLAPRDREPRGLAARDGVDCVTCHYQGGAFVPVRSTYSEQARAGWSRALIDAPPGAYSTSPAAAPGSSEFCGTCHQIHFLVAPAPESVTYDSAEWLQDTYREWLGSEVARAGVRCQDCHMPAVVGADGRAHTSHRFPGMYDEALVRRAVSVELTARREGGHVRVDARVLPRMIGHAFPTGDMFREAVLEVWTVEPASARASARLRRSFKIVAKDAPAREEPELVYAGDEDTRVPAPGGDASPRALAFRLRSPAARELRWTLKLYARTAERGPSREYTEVASGRAAITPDPNLRSRSRSPR